MSKLIPFEDHPTYSGTNQAEPTELTKSLEKKCNSAMVKIYNKYKTRALKKGVEFSIPMDTFKEIIVSKCYYFPYFSW